VQYRYVLITDGQAPIPNELRRNIDMPTGPATRASLFNNGLWLELPPFNVNADVAQEYTLEDGFPRGENLRTLLIDNTRLPKVSNS
jgi:hypothetical protein